MSVKKRTYERNGRTTTVWRARLWVYPPHGGRKEVSRDFQTRREAEGWERTQISRSRNRVIDVERTRIADAGLWSRAEPVLRATLSPKTLDHYRRGWESRVLPTLGNVKVGALTVGDVERAQAAWAAEGVGPSTVRQARQALSAVLTVAVRDGLIGANPARIAQRPGGDRSARDSRNVGRPLTPAQLTTLVQRVRAEAGEPYATMVDLLGSAGVRYGEAAALKVEDVDLGAGRMTVRRSVTEVTKADGALREGHVRDGNLVWGPPKGGRSRTVPVPVHLRPQLAALIGTRHRGQLLFGSERGHKVVRRNSLVRKVGWSKLLADLGCAGVRVHDLRATAATNLLAAGVPPHVVRDILGHRDLAVTSLYARAQDGALDQAAAAMEALRAG